MTAALQAPPPAAHPAHPPPLPPGATLLPEFLDPGAESILAADLDARSWDTVGGRRVQHFGYRYDYRARSASEATPATPFPGWMAELARRIAAATGSDRPEQCIVNEYRPGQGIGMHADSPAFGPLVASLSTGAAWPMRFRPRNRRPYARGGQPDDLVATLPRRSLLVLRDGARNDWMHGICPRDSARQHGRRISLTFRTLARA